LTAIRRVHLRNLAMIGRWRKSNVTTFSKGAENRFNPEPAALALLTIEHATQFGSLRVVGPTKTLLNRNQ
jgi:hypothetical protein